MKKFIPVNFNAAIKGNVLSGYRTVRFNAIFMQFYFRKNLAAVLLLIFLLSDLWVHAQATTKYWNGGNGTGMDWTLGTNWRDGNNVIGTPPVAGDDIVFNNPDLTISFSIMPANDVSYNSLTIVKGRFIVCGVKPIFITIGGNTNTDFGGGADIDLFIKESRTLELVSNISIKLASNAHAIIFGELIIRNTCAYYTDLPGAHTEVTGLSGSSYNRGFVTNQGIFTSASPSNLAFNSSSTYQHWRNGGQVPKATWHTSSTCHIFLANIPPDSSSFGQEFGNLIWECKPRRMNYNATVAPFLKKVKGNLDIRLTGSSEYPTTNYIIISNAGTGTLDIGGTFRVGGFVHIDGGNVNVAGGTSIYRIIDSIHPAALLTMNGGILNTPILNVGPHIYFKENSFFNPTTGITILGGTVYINGALTIHPSCVFRSTNAPAINIKGNLTNNGSYLKDQETVTFNGTGLQTIGGTSVTTFYNLNINNAAGVSLQQDTRVWNTLNFTSGKIATGTQTLTLDVNATPVSGAGAGKYVYGNLSICIPANTASVTFPIGDATAYTPVTLAFSGTPTNTIGDITASTKTGKHPNIASTGIYGIDSTKSLKRYFTLTNNGATFGSCSATFTFIPTDLPGAADPLIFMVQRFAPNSWYPTTIGTLTTTTTQVTGLLQTDFGDFQAGQMKCTAPINTYTVTGGGSYCVGNTGAEVGLSNSQAGVVYQLRVNGVNTGSPVPGGGSSISFGNQALPGTYTVLATRVIGGCYSTMNNSVSIP